MTPREILKEIPRWDVAGAFTNNKKIDQALFALRAWVGVKKKALVGDLNDKSLEALRQVSIKLYGDDTKKGALAMVELVIIGMSFYNQALEDLAKELK